MTSFNLSLSPLIPIWMLIALAVLGIFTVALGIYARRRGTWLRAIGLGLVLAALADPSLVREDRNPLKDVVAVVFDKSASQNIGDRKAQTQKSRAEIEKAFEALGNIEPRFVEGGGTDSGNDGTRLFSALNLALSDVPPERVGGAIIVTDGVVHDIPANAGALGFRAPLHVFVTGHAGERDRRIELVEAPRFGIVGKDQTIVARVLDSGDRGEPVTIIIKRDGVQIATLRAAVGQLVRAPVRIEHGGPNVFELDVAVLPNELTDVNNKAVVTIEGVRDKLKVLLVSGEPHAGERTWRNLLKSDANVELVHFTILRPPDKQDGTPINELSLIAFPTADLFGRKINEFDLIIFDRYSNQTILPSVYFQNIVKYVRDGGAMLMAVGPDYSGRDGLFYSALGGIAPGKPDGRLIERAFRAKITDDGLKHPVTRDLPGSKASPPAWSEWYRLVRTEKTRGVSIMSGADDMPLLLLSREGKGRVALLTSDQMWLWARGFQGGGPHIDLLRKLAHWLMKEPELEEEALRATARGRDMTVTRQSLKPEIPDITITSPSGAKQTLSLAAGDPGLSTGKVTVEEFGLYRLTDGTLMTLVNIGPENPREFQEVVSSLDKLKPLAEATGGTVRRIGVESSDAINLPRFTAMRESPLYGGSDYIGIKRTGASVITGVGVAPLAIGFLGLIALLGSVLMGWLWEGKRKKA